MNWYYAENNERHGPVDSSAFDGLIRSGKVQPGTLVWREGMAAWQSLAESGYQPTNAAIPSVDPASPPPPPGTEMGVCSESGRILPRDELIEIDGRLVSAEYKNVVLQRIREGVSGGGAVADPEVLWQEIQERDYSVAIRSCLSRAFGLVKKNFWLTVGGTTLAYLVLFAASAIPLGGLLVQGPLIAGIYWLMLRLIRGESAGVGDAFQGFSRDWGQLVAAALVSGLLVVPALLPGIVILITSGVEKTGAASTMAVVGGVLMFIGVLVAMYFTIAWVFALPLIIDKRIPFWPAMKLSRRVVGMHWWQVFGLLFTAGLVMMALLFAGILVVSLIGGAAFLGLGKGNDPSAAMVLVIPFILVLALLFLTLLPVVFAALMFAYEDIFQKRPALQS
jgi:hypothetical protein